MEECSCWLFATSGSDFIYNPTLILVCLHSVHFDSTHPRELPFLDIALRPHSSVWGLSWGPSHLSQENIHSDSGFYCQALVQLPTLSFELWVFESQSSSQFCRSMHELYISELKIFIVCTLPWELVAAPLMWRAWKLTPPSSQLPPAQGFSICNNFFPPENFVNTSICWEAQLDVNIVYIENLNS